MTFSILARDPDSDRIGGAAATGSLCVGGWVLRGRAGVGMSASQGKAPSTIWGETVLEYMRDGASAEIALRKAVDNDRGREQRQLCVMDAYGLGAAFSGNENTPHVANRVFDGGVASGNMLADTNVVDAMVEAYMSSSADFTRRLLAALRAAEDAGGDARGLKSAALLVLSPSAAPLTLRVDFGDEPLSILDALYVRATTGDYADWAVTVPTLDEPERTCD